VNRITDLDSTIKSIMLFAPLLGIIAWCAFGVVQHAGHLAEVLGELSGTLILTLSSLSWRWRLSLP
jgi:Ca2+:H+ antiporter